MAFSSESIMPMSVGTTRHENGQVVALSAAKSPLSGVLRRDGFFVARSRRALKNDILAEAAFS